MPLSLFAPLEDLIAPAPAPDRVAFLKAQPFAHRGLHGGGVVENSRAAFRAAIALGHGIETDVQAARDGEAMVFHDATLDRLTMVTGEVGIAVNVILPSAAFVDVDGDALTWRISAVPAGLTFESGRAAP